MNWEKFKSKFHPSWHSSIKPFIESKECDEIFVFLKQKKAEGIEICPSSFCLFSCFKNTKLDELKCVVIGENPYNKIVDGAPIDTGTLFEASTRMQPNLQEFYRGIEKDLYNGLNLDIIYDYELEYLTSQGILMMPSSLTIEENAEKGHNKLWKPFMEFLLVSVIGYSGVPILFLGKSKQYMSLVEQSNYCYDLPMPKFGNIWDTKQVFSKINENVWDSNEDTIMWLKIKVPF